MTDNEIIKALECCRQKEEHCHICPYNPIDDCCRHLLKDALDLINRHNADIKGLEDSERIGDQLIERQRAEIERLQKSNEEMFCTISKQDAEITQLQKRIVFWREDMNYQPEKERTEAIKEFAKRLKSEMYTVGFDIDNLVKEMTER